MASSPSSNRPRGGALRRLATGLATTGGATVLGLLVLEIALRIAAGRGGGAGEDLDRRLEASRRAQLGEAPDPVSLRGLVEPSRHPEIVYEAKPGLRGRFQGHALRINSHGMRDREIPVEKPPGVYRIVGLGDSVMFGWGVGQDETFLRVLERMLDTRSPGGPRFETLNFALPGYNTTMEVATFEAKALAFEPDLVVVQFINNDWGVPHFMRSPEDPWTLDRSFLRDFVRARLGRGAGAGNERLLDGGLDGLDGETKVRVLAPYRHMIGPEGYRRAMDRLAALTVPRRVPVVVVRGSCTDEQRRVIDEVVRRHGFHVIDVGPHTDRVLAERGVPDTRAAKRDALWVSPDDHHPNALGHEIYALALFETLRELPGFPAADAVPSSGAAAVDSPETPAQEGRP